MKAVVVRGGRRFAYETIDRPVVGAGETLLKVEATGICAADRKIYAGEHPWHLPDPYVPGHEYVGSVVELGEGTETTTGLRVGDLATAEIVVPCRTCWYCHRGLYHLCDGQKSCVGSWAEYLRIPAGALVHRIPKTLDCRSAVLVEPLACSIHSVNLARIGLEDTVVISGLGAIGMGALQVARLRNPRMLIGLDVDERLLTLASDHGADVVMNPRGQDAVAAIRSITGGRGADIYLEASGAPTSVHTGLDALRKAGRMVVFGVYGRRAEIDLNIISEHKELEVVGGHLSPNAFPLAISYLAEGRVDARMMVTDVFPLCEYDEAIRVRESSDKASIKTIMVPG